MARNVHSYAKRQLEIEKKRKADEKRARRLARKNGTLNEENEEETSAETGTETPESPENPKKEETAGEP